MDNLKKEYKWSVQVKPNGFTLFIMPKDAPLVPAICVVCAVDGKHGNVGPRTNSERENRYQMCSSGQHQFFWRGSGKDRFIEPLAGRPPAHNAPIPSKRPSSGSKNCATTGCSKRVPAGCSQGRCIDCCESHARSEYQQGRDPLNLCKMHLERIQRMVKNEESAARESLELDDNTILQHTRAASSASGHAQPLTTGSKSTTSYRRSGNKSSASDQSSRENRSNVGNNDPPVPPRHSPAATASAPRQTRGVLANPSVPVPRAIALGDRPIFQHGEIRLKRNNTLGALARNQSEDAAASLGRRIIIHWWKPDGSNGNLAITNAKEFTSFTVLNSHAKVMELFATDGKPAQYIATYDWEERIWVVSHVEEAVPLGERARLLIRGENMTDEMCLGWEAVRDKEPKVVQHGERGLPVIKQLNGLDATSQQPSHKRKRSEDKTVDNVAIKKPKASSSIAPSLPKPTTTVIITDPPLPTNEEPSDPTDNHNTRIRDVNPDKGSWLLRATVSVVEECLRNSIKHQSTGLTVEKAYMQAFKEANEALNEEPLKYSESTYRRHLGALNKAKKVQKLDWWIKNRGDAKWAEFYNTFHVPEKRKRRMTSKKKREEGKDEEMEQPAEDQEMREIDAVQGVDNAPGETSTEGEDETDSEETDSNIDDPQPRRLDKGKGRVVQSDGEWEPHASLLGDVREQAEGEDSWEPHASLLGDVGEQAEGGDGWEPHASLLGDTREMALENTEESKGSTSTTQVIATVPEPATSPSPSPSPPPQKPLWLPPNLIAREWARVGCGRCLQPFPRYPSVRVFAILWELSDRPTWEIGLKNGFMPGWSTAADNILFQKLCRLHASDMEIQGEPGEPRCPSTNPMQRDFCVTVDKLPYPDFPSPSLLKMVSETNTSSGWEEVCRLHDLEAMGPVRARIEGWKFFWEPEELLARLELLEPELDFFVRNPGGRLWDRIKADAWAKGGTLKVQDELSYAIPADGYAGMTSYGYFGEAGAEIILMYIKNRYDPRAHETVSPSSWTPIASDLLHYNIDIFLNFCVAPYTVSLLIADDVNQSSLDYLVWSHQVLSTSLGDIVNRSHDFVKQEDTDLYNNDRNHWRRILRSATRQIDQANHSMIKQEPEEPVIKQEIVDTVLGDASEDEVAFKEVVENGQTYLILDD